MSDPDQAATPANLTTTRPAPHTPVWNTGRYAVWLGLAALPDDKGELRELGGEIEALGYAALWLGGSWGVDLTIPAELLAGSTRLVVGTSIANIWRDPADQVAGSYTAVAAEFGERFVLGLGPGHAAQVDLHNNNYARPLAALTGYLDELDASTPPVPVGQRALAALGPKALRLAADRSAGALPYLTTPGHTRQAREAVGDLFLAPEQKVVLMDEPAEARTVARRALKPYLELPNYVNAWRRLGFGEAEFEHGGSDTLVDALIAWGPPEQVLGRVGEHLDAGADQVCIQPVPAPGRTARDELRVLAGLLS